MNTFGKKFLGSLLAQAKQSTTYTGLLRACALAMTIGLTLLCTSCTRIDPAAPLAKKWEIVSKFVPATQSYLVVIDNKTLTESEIYKAIAKDDPKSIPAMIKSAGDNPANGITVINDGMVFLGGAFDTKELSKKIVATVTETGGNITEEKIKGKTLFVDKRMKAGFVFLKPYLLVQGDETKLKELIAGNLKPTTSTIDTTHTFWAKFIAPKEVNKEMTELVIFGDAAKTFKVFASAEFTNSEFAKVFYDEAQGYKTLKTIQSIDEPWISDAIDAIDIKLDGKKINFSADLEARPARSLLRIFTK